MPESVYKIIEVVGTSPTSWEEAAKKAVEKVGENLRDLRIAEIIATDLKVENNKVTAYRARVKISFKYED
jgi:dodecin